MCFEHHTTQANVFEEHFGDAIRCKWFQKEPTLTEKGPYIPPQECKRAHIFQIFTAVEEDGNVYISGMATIKLKGFIRSILLLIWQQSVYLPFRYEYQLVDLCES